MATRTWIPALYDTLHLVCVYTARWDAQIRVHLPSDAIPAYEALKVACDVFEAILYPLITRGS